MRCSECGWVSRKCSEQECFVQEFKDVVKRSTSEILDELGDMLDDEVKLHTPLRVARMYEELLQGYLMEFPRVKLDKAKSNSSVATSFSFASLCQHHMLPYFGTVSIMYKPDRYILGLSKFKRVVDFRAKRLTLQEGLTSSIADDFFELLKPKWLYVEIEARHMCAWIRGVEEEVVMKTTVEKNSKYDVR